MTVSAGETVRLTLTFESTARNIGFYLTATTGQLAPVAGEPTKAAGDGITHSSAINLSGGRAVVSADWTAPSAPGGVNFIAAAVAGNGDGRSSSDGEDNTMVAMAFGCSTGALYYRDFDGDGFGHSEGNYTRSCGKPEGYGENFGDCDDNDQKIFPGATEICNRRDDDCNGTTDEGLEGVMLYPDEDGDGWGRRRGVDQVMIGCAMERGWGIEGNDCDDGDAEIFPGAAEICNLKDDDCDGRVDEGARADCGEGWCRRIAPGCDGSTCTPGKPQKERCNLLDDDCDGQTDEDPGTLCEEGTTCLAGRCEPGDEPAPGPGSGGQGMAGAGDDGAGGGGGGGGGEDPAPSRGAGCAFGPTAVSPPLAWLALGLALFWRRQRRSP